MNEAETRAEHVDPALKAAGWGVVAASRILREYRIEGHGRRGKPLNRRFSSRFNGKQQVFLDFVLSHYVTWLTDERV